MDLKPQSASALHNPSDMIQKLEQAIHITQLSLESIEENNERKICNIILFL
jgi:hypothetical protein